MHFMHLKLLNFMIISKIATLAEIGILKPKYMHSACMIPNSLNQAEIFAKLSKFFIL